MLRGLERVLQAGKEAEKLQATSAALEQKPDAGGAATDAGTGRSSGSGSVSMSMSGFSVLSSDGDLDPDEEKDLLEETVGLGKRAVQELEELSLEKRMSGAGCVVHVCVYVRVCVRVCV
jgi:hypothetical protein